MLYICVENMDGLN